MRKSRWAFSGRVRLYVAPRYRSGGPGSMQFVGADAQMGETKTTVRRDPPAFNSTFSSQVCLNIVMFHLLTNSIFRDARDPRNAGITLIMICFPPQKGNRPNGQPFPGPGRHKYTQLCIHQRAL